MRKYPVILDIETQRTFRDTPKHKDLGISVVGIYDYKERASFAFREHELTRLFTLLENASYIIGYNNRGFDLPVLQGHYPGDIMQFSVFDLCEDLKERIGKRFSLGDLAYATLGKNKTGHGLIAIDLYQQGRWDELTKYCLDDVRLTKDLLEFGINNGYICFLSERGKEKVTVSWKKYLEDSEAKNISLTLPF